MDELLICWAHAGSRGRRGGGGRLWRYTGMILGKSNHESSGTIAESTYCGILKGPDVLTPQFGTEVRWLNTTWFEDPKFMSQLPSDANPNGPTITRVEGTLV